MAATTSACSTEDQGVIQSSSVQSFLGCASPARHWAHHLLCPPLPSYSCSQRCHCLLASKTTHALSAGEPLGLTLAEVTLVGSVAYNMVRTCFTGQEPGMSRWQYGLDGKNSSLACKSAWALYLLCSLGMLVSGLDHPAVIWWWHLITNRLGIKQRLINFNILVVIDLFAIYSTVIF